MRFYRKATILLSEDDSTSPKDIRFYDVERETLNRTALIEGGSGTNVIEPGDTFTLPMGQISLGKYCYLYSTGAFELVINGADKTFNMAALVPNEMWMDFTTLTVTNNASSADDIRLTWVIGGN
jgi:hypothetical protein